MIMEPSHYLPSEVLKHSNYPEIELVKSDLAKIDAFASEVSIALAQFNEVIADKVYVNVGELHEHISLCRSVLETLGNAKSPCFDLIVDLREVLQLFFEVSYADRAHKGQYVADLPGGGS
jgi:hypothetical protein